MASTEMIEKLATRATAAEQMIQILTKQIEEIKANQGKGDSAQEIRTLRAENAQLKSEILEAKQKLIDAEKAAGISTVEFKAPAQQVAPEAPVVREDKAKEKTPPAPKKEKAKKEKKEPEKKPDGGAGGDSVDIGR